MYGNFGAMSPYSMNSFGSNPYASMGGSPHMGSNRPYSPMSANGMYSPSTPYSQNGLLPSRSPFVAPAARNDDPDDWVKQDPHLTSSRQQARRSAVGLNGQQAVIFGKSHEFVSLGNYCGVARALESLSLRNFSYMFDWGRSPLDGIIHLVENEFEDFFAPTSRKFKDQHTVFSCSGWGGSFWHHDISNPKVVSDFKRRIDRFYGRKEVSATAPRVFVRALNSTREVKLVPSLMKALRTALPQAPIKLLLLVDLQRNQEVLKVQDEDFDDVLIACVRSEHVFAKPNFEIEDISSLYAEAIAKAVLVWSTGKPSHRVREVASLAELRDTLAPFDGRNPRDELFTPRRVQEPVGVRRPPAQRADVRVKAPNSPRQPSQRDAVQDASPARRAQRTPRTPEAGNRHTEPPQRLAEAANRLGEPGGSISCGEGTRLTPTRNRQSRQGLQPSLGGRSGTPGAGTPRVPASPVSRSLPAFQGSSIPPHFGGPGFGGFGGAMQCR